MSFQYGNDLFGCISAVELESSEVSQGSLQTENTVSLGFVCRASIYLL